MTKLRIYLDTSVFGGCFDDEFAKDSKRLIEEIKALTQSYNRILAITPRMTEAIKAYADEVVLLDDTGLPDVFLALPMALAMHLVMIYRGWEYGIGSDHPFGRGGRRGINTTIYPLGS